MHVCFPWAILPLSGTGVTHSEYNRNTTQEVHFLQCWAKPHTSGLSPSYYNRVFPRESKLDKIIPVVAPLGSPGVVDKREGDGPTPIHANVTMFASILTPKAVVKHELKPDTVRAYLHLAMKSGYRKPTVSASEKYEDGGAILQVNGGLLLEEGDGAFVKIDKDATGSRSLEFKNTAEREAEFVVFEMSE